MKETLRGIADSIKAARKKKGWSQKTLSEKVGIPQSHLSKIEQGKVDLQTSSLIEIARTLDLEPLLISRKYVSLVQAIQNGSPISDSTPMYQLKEGDADG